MMAGHANLGRAVLDRHIAYHEAGRALMALLCGRTLQSVSLTDGRAVLDATRTIELLESDRLLDDDDRRYLMDEVRIAMAGTARSLSLWAEPFPQAQRPISLRRIPSSNASAQGPQRGGVFKKM